MVANIRGYTPNYNFKLINFDTPRWHTLEYSNWNMVDAMFLQGGIPQIRGVWTNDTAYLEGDRVFDEETSATYRCLIEHESPELGTFAEFRSLNPNHWSLQLSGVPVYRGEWQPSVTYVLGDIVYIDAYEYFLCTMANVSSGDFASDAVKWQTIFDATQVVTDAEAAKDAAYQFSLDAEASANAALTSENNAETAEEGAEDWADDARAASGAFRWAFSSSTTATDPAVGRIAFNNATPTAVTEIYLNAKSSETGNPDVSAWVETWDDSNNPNTRGTLQLRKVGAPEQFLIFNLTNNIVDNGTWLRLPVAYVSHSGLLANADPISVGFVRAGNAGPTGTGGGDMLKANNLSDVASIPTSRTNLGLGTAQIPTFSQVLHTSPPTAPTHGATKEYVDASPSLYVSDTAPASVLAGSLWWDSDKGTLYVRYNDGTSTQWVEAVAVPGLDTSSLVKRAGDTMTGLLTLSGDPDAALKAATKQYVDNRVTTSAGPISALAYSGIQINGGMEVDQEFAGSETYNWLNNGHYAIDGWMVSIGQAVPGSTAIKVQMTGADIPGIRYCLAVTATGAANFATASDLAIVTQRIEGTRWAPLGFGFTVAQPVTVGFWIFSPIAGTICVSLIGGGTPTHIYIKEVVVNAADIWEYKTITFPPDTTGTLGSWPIDNGIGCNLLFCFGGGSTTKGGTANVWTTATSGQYATPNQSNFFGTNNHAIYLTGVTIIPGSYAPIAEQSPLLMRPYGEELTTCMRYYQTTSVSIRLYSVGAGSNYIYPLPFTVAMRVSPTCLAGGGSGSNISAISVNPESHVSGSVNLTATSAGDAYWFGRYITMDARL